MSPLIKRGSRKGTVRCKKCQAIPNRIERSDILEFRTNKDVHCKSYIDDKFEVVMPWWS